MGCAQLDSTEMLAGCRSRSRHRPLTIRGQETRAANLSSASTCSPVMPVYLAGGREQELGKLDLLNSLGTAVDEVVVDPAERTRVVLQQVHDRDRPCARPGYASRGGSCDSAASGARSGVPRARRCRLGRVAGSRSSRSPHRRCRARAPRRRGRHGRKRPTSPAATCGIRRGRSNFGVPFGREVGWEARHRRHRGTATAV